MGETPARILSFFSEDFTKVRMFSKDFGRAFGLMKGTGSKILNLEHFRDCSNKDVKHRSHFGAPLGIKVRLGNGDLLI